MNRARILYEDNDIIVCHKAAGIATQTARVGQADMVSEVINYLTRKSKTQNGHGPAGSSGQMRKGGTQTFPYIGVVHRLDQPVEGVLVFARNKQAAAELSRQITENRMEKYYYAVICGHEFEKSGQLTDYLLKDGRTNTSHIVPPEVKDAKKAVLEYEVVKEISVPEYVSGILTEYTAGENESQHRIALARIRLHTGRHHQIRVQMSHAGMSLLGDYKYADAETVKLSEQMKVKEIALCAYQLSFKHPKTGEKMQFQIKPEGKSFQNYIEP